MRVIDFNVERRAARRPTHRPRSSYGESASPSAHAESLFESQMPVACENRLFSRLIAIPHSSNNMIIRRRASTAAPASSSRWPREAGSEALVDGVGNPPQEKAGKAMRTLMQAGAPIFEAG